MIESPKANHEKTLDFLRSWNPAGPWVLTAIDVEGGGITTATFSPKADFHCTPWLDKNCHRNLYFHVNSTTHELEKKASLGDIKSVDWLHVDIDPRAGEDLGEERKRALDLLTTNLPKDVPAPTVIIFSGGGYQAFWKLAIPIAINGDLELADDAKRWNQWLESRFQADQCHNVDRIMRLPGTVNWPNAKKRAKKREPTLATLVKFEGEALPLSAFKQADSVKAVAVEVASESTHIDFDALGKRLDPKTVEIIKLGTDPDNPKRWGGDRSDGVWFVSCQMARARFDYGEIMRVLLSKSAGISAHVFDQKKPTKYAQRQANKALEEAESNFTVNPKTDKPGKGQRNIRLAIRKLGVSLSYDEFASNSIINGLDDHEGLLQDDAVMVLRLLIDENFGFLPDRAFFLEVVKAYALQNRFDPVLDYLDSLTWDGEPRIDQWLSTYGGAEDSEYTRAVGSLMFVAGVRRPRDPGCKFDEMIVFISKQGLNKSSAILALLPSSDLFTDDLPLNVDSQKVIEKLSGVWIAEFAELQGKTVAGIEHVKAFLSRRVDKARGAYGRIAEVVPRRQIFIGTTNNDKFMNDPTGGRRFWPVHVKKFDLKALRRDRDQLWAEAAHREASGESIRLDPSLYEVAKVEQDRATAENPFTPVLALALGDIKGKIHTANVWAILNIASDRRTQAHNNYVHDAMKELGWTRKKARIERKLEYCYIKDNAKFPKEVNVWRDRNGQWHAGVMNSDELKRKLTELEESEAEERQNMAQDMEARQYDMEAA